MTDQATKPRAEEFLLGVLNGAKPPAPEVFLDLFSELEPVSVEAMLGLWRVASLGGKARERIAAQPAAGPLPRREGLGMTNLYGKRFVSRDEAEPIVVTLDDGSLAASTDFGVSRLRELAFRGVTSAGMVYDQQPWIDYFRALDDDTLVAVIDMKGRPLGTGFFLLRG